MQEPLHKRYENAMKDPTILRLCKAAETGPAARDEGACENVVSYLQETYRLTAEDAEGINSTLVHQIREEAARG